MKVIYCLENKINGKKYVGVDTRWPKRLGLHKVLAETNRGFAIHNAIRKYGWENFNKEIIEEVTNDNIYEREMFWIKVLDTKNTGYNETDGGEGALGRVLSEETKIKMSMSALGNKNSIGNKGRSKPHTEETKEKIRIASIKHRKEKFWSTRKGFTNEKL